jgi:uncharacterized protein
MEGVVPDAVANDIINNFIKPAFREGNYYKGLDDAVTAIEKAAAGEYKGSPKKDDSGISIGGIFLLIMLIIIVIAMISRGGGGGNGTTYNRRGGWIWPVIGGMSSGWGSGSSSGGGWSGGGGFGGFGGGSGGGGGASGSW